MGQLSLNYKNPLISTRKELVITINSLFIKKRKNIVITKMPACTMSLMKSWIDNGNHLLILIQW